VTRNDAAEDHAAIEFVERAMNSSFTNLGISKVARISNDELTRFIGGAGRRCDREPVETGPTAEPHGAALPRRLQG
jgi:hypothetical protein